MPDWVNTTCPVCAVPAKRETDTMPNWAGSNWYYLGYLLADKLGNPNLVSRHAEFISASRAKNEIPKQVRDDSSGDIFSQNRESIDHWMPVDIYEGGFEHTTLHLLYSRFIYKFLFDLGVVPGPEPYAKRRSHGIVLGPDGRKMSKSFGNVINPDEIVKQYGSDALRLYEMFMGPFEQSVNWSDSSLQGCYRFLTRVNRLALKNVSKEATPRALEVALQAATKKVGEDIEALKFNTAVAILMEFINGWENNNLNSKDANNFLRLLAPFAPHLAEELWHKLLISPDRGADSRGSIHLLSWPVYDPELLKQDRVFVVVQVNGKLRDRFEVEASADEQSVAAVAKACPKVRKYLTAAPSKIIYVPGKLINFVVN
jgi:leucyl-tRNA synthetase